MRSVFRPLVMSSWQGPTTDPSRRRSKWTFQAGWTDTMKMLDAEIEKLGADMFVIEADFRESDIRRDGSFPLANARPPAFPGIRVAFESRHGPLVYQTDTCVWWQHNVRSIALGLEALRAVDRYGITHRAEQYTGFKAIGGGSSNGFVDADDALRWLQSPEVCGFAGAQGVELSKLLKLVARRHHPDMGGDPTMWAKYDHAAQLLRRSGRVK